MNHLSWILYLGNVAVSLGVLFCMLGVVIAAFSIFQVVFLFRLLDDYKISVNYYGNNEKTSNNLTRIKFQRWVTLWLLILAFILFFLSALCPSSDTVYAIAASEMGDQVLKTPIAGKAEQALEKWLDKQTSSNN